MTTKKPDDLHIKRGRPRLQEPGTSVSTWLRPGEHDKLIKLAKDNEQSISSLVRSLLKLKL
jgi:hypothetical protein